MAIQPGIDRALSRNILESCPVQATEDLITEENLEQQCFSVVHRIVLRLLRRDLSDTIRHSSWDVDSVDANGRTALHWAAWRGDGPTVNLLIQHGAEVNKTDYEGFTPLSRAAQAGHLYTVKILLHAGASMLIVTAWGYQPIHLASRNKLDGHKIVRELLAAGGDPNAYSHGSGTPLHDAAICGSMDTVDILLAHGVKINTTSDAGNTAAMVALYCWNEHVFLRLATLGARLDVANNVGHNILLPAIWTASTKTWDLLAAFARETKLGFVDIAVLHAGHDIHYCFGKCRSLCFIGKREEKAERTSFERMVQSIGVTL